MIHLTQADINLLLALHRMGGISYGLTCLFSAGKISKRTGFYSIKRLEELGIICIERKPASPDIISLKPGIHF